LETIGGKKRYSHKVMGEPAMKVKVKVKIKSKILMLHPQKPQVISYRLAS
jgi:hypothetical protein